MKKTKLRALPQIDRLLSSEGFLGLIKQYSERQVRNSLRLVLADSRSSILKDQSKVDLARLKDESYWLFKVKLDLSSNQGMKPVINCTGVVLHTNLGRSPMSDKIAKKLSLVISSYSNLEFDLATGKRGSRQEYLGRMLQDLLGVEAGLVVNNNAAAMLLILDELAKGQEVIVSRGELVEIGGSFRIPEIMSQSGAILHEVGASNKCHYHDYERAINEKTAAILKVHTSNYKISGFTLEQDLISLRKLADQAGLPLIYDLGSGFLEQELIPWLDEPSAKEALAAQPDLLCFSGDKLLGGPQAGIIVGKEKYIKRLAKNPFMRAIRPGKLSLLALEACLSSYFDLEQVKKENRLLQVLHQDLAVIEARAKRLQALVLEAGIELELEEVLAKIGGGSTPDLTLPSLALSLDRSAEELVSNLRSLDLPVIARINQGRVYFDMIAVFDEQVEVLAQGIIQAVRELE